MNESAVGRFLPPTVTVALILLGWHFGVRLLAVPAYLVPTPLDVLAALRDGLIGGLLWPHIGVTLTEIVVGYAVGCGLALGLATLVAEFRWLDRAIYPVLIAIQSVPKVALAPILLVWLGFEMESKIVMVALICFFPTFVSSLAGLRAADADLLDLYRTLDAGRWRTFREVKAPAALSQAFSGLEISVVLALIGAIVAELVASRAGLGHVISASAANFNVAMMFACVVLLALIGVTLSQLVRALRRRLIFWEKSRQPGSAAVLRSAL